MSEKRYPVYRAWCRKNNKKIIIRYGEVKDSHGICDSCKIEYLKTNGLTEEDHES